MQTVAKCPECGAAHKPPTYWQSLSDGEKVFAVFVMIGVGCVAVCLGFLMLMKAIGWLTDNLPTMY
jgi:hypothetical protein